MASQNVQRFDVVVVGSGFGGSVAALRLCEKNYSVAVIEAGRRFSDSDFPKTSWQLSRFLYFPRLGLNGIQRIHALPDVLILAGAGVGGGSLVYANTLYQPPQSYFDDRQWSHITDWREELAPCYEQATRMLGVEKNPHMTPSDIAMKKVADEMGVGQTFTLAPLGVHFGEGSGVQSEDPYFGGKGEARNGCTQCGACMTGCRFNAKNTLPKNYLGLAEKIGAEVFAEETVIKIEELQNKEWKITTRKSSSWFGRKKFYVAKDVVVAAGTYNSQKLLHQMKISGVLPHISQALGNLSRTNSEALTGAIMKHSSPIDFSVGAAITSSFYPDSQTHVEPVRYGKGSNFMGLLQTVMSDGQAAGARRRNWLRTVLRKPHHLLRIMDVRDWSQRGVIALVMQNVDSSISVIGKKFLSFTYLTSKNDPTNPNATYIPAANQVARSIAREYDGIAAGHVGDLISAPFTAHFVGGCVISDNPETGVIDPYHRTWNYPRLHIVDGSTLTANLGVNPSLTITAQAERAFSLWPNAGEEDLRPEQGKKYQKIQAIAPKNPAVPMSAPGAYTIS